MNIFVLDTNPELAARYHCDSHVIKMMLESAQLLSTAYRFHNPDCPENFCYKSTHINHPCSIWTRTSRENFQWLTNLYEALVKEWNYRYGHINRKHASHWVVSNLDSKNIPTIGYVTPFALAMPKDCKIGTVVDSYRVYYKTHKKDIVSWKKRETPYWW